MTEKQVILNDTTGEKPQKKYTFDHAFWSHDGFTNDDKGYSHPNAGSNYTD